jgi:hypothetical protein
MDSAGRLELIIDAIIAQIEAAFAFVLRPDNDALLWDQCFDDNDIAALYDVAHWRDVPDTMVENEYAALSFLSPAGFQHFIPAYMRWVLRHPDGGAAVVGSTLWALTPEWSLVKFGDFDAAQRAAVIAFLEAMTAFDEDAWRGLEYWLDTANL